MAKGPFKMKGYSYPGTAPTRKTTETETEFEAVRGGTGSTVDPGVARTVLPTVDVKPEEVTHTITRDPKTGDDIYTKSRGDKSAEFIKNPDYRKGAPGNNYKWIRRDGASDQYGPIGFN